jgi:putative ABC transport system ATP-binding protein
MNAINIKNLEFSYPSSLNPVIKINDLQIAEGERVFLFGPSGHGKSTLLNLLAGVLDSKKGDLNVLGHNLSLLSQNKKDLLRGSEIGYIFQIFNLIPYLNLKENIILPCLINKKRAHGVDYEKQADELIVTLGLVDHINKPVTDLSIGQQQRVAAARALIGNPKLIIADEPTSSLDETNTTEFMNLLIREWEKRQFTLIFVSHDERLKKYFKTTISLPSVNLV